MTNTVVNMEYTPTSSVFWLMNDAYKAGYSTFKESEKVLEDGRRKLSEDDKIRQPDWWMNGSANPFTEGSTRHKEWERGFNAAYFYTQRYRHRMEPVWAERKRQAQAARNKR